MKIVFISGLYSVGSEAELLAQCKGTGLQNASNTFQWALVQGLLDNNIDLKVLSFPYLPCFPFGYKSVFTPELPIWYEVKEIGTMISYCTVPVIKKWHIQGLIKKKLKQIVKANCGNEPIYVITYTASPSFISPLISLKKQYDIRICPIITDLIEFYNDPIYNRSFLKKLQGNIEKEQTVKNYPFIDKFVLLTEAMKEIIPTARDKSIVVEGIAAVRKDLYIGGKVYDKQRTLLYTGALAAHSCVNELVESFCLTSNPEFRLVICGDGVWKDYIKERAKTDKRIIYKGLVSRNEAVSLQKEATALINPRKPNLSVTKYSFPSKTMEYLSSGTPMIGYKLEGIPQEYYKYYYTVEDMTAEGLAKVIDQVLTKPAEELSTKAKEAFDFIVENKTAKEQASKIIDFISE